MPQHPQRISRRRFLAGSALVAGGAGTNAQGLATELDPYLDRSSVLRKATLWYTGRCSRRPGSSR